MNENQAKPEIDRDPVEEILQTLKNNQRVIFTVVVAAIVAFGAFAGLQEYRKSVELEAQAALFKAEKSLESLETEIKKKQQEAAKNKKKLSEVEPVDFDKDYAPVAEHLKKVIQDYSGTKASVRASMILASLYTKNKKPEEALAAVEMVQKTPSEEALSILFQFQKASVLLEAGKFDAAISLFDKISQAKDFEYMHAFSKLKKAMALEKSGKTTEAQSLYKDISTDYPDHKAGQMARQYLRLMEY